MYICLSCSSLLLHPLPHPLTTQEDDVLELELDDIEEEEELEELEEGHCHDITQDVSDKTRASSSLISDEEETERPKSRKQRVVYVQISLSTLYRQQLWCTGFNYWCACTVFMLIKWKI